MSRLSPVLIQASRLAPLMAMRSHSWTPIPHESHSASAIQSTAEAASANANRSARASAGSTDSHRMLIGGSAATTKQSSSRASRSLTAPRDGGAPKAPYREWMTEEDRLRWDARHSGEGSDDPENYGPPEVFADHEHLFPRTGFALDLACGTGAGSVWLAALGLDVYGVDISGAGLDRARRLAVRRGMSSRCRFHLADLDHGLPPSPLADVILCHMFRDPRLYRPIADRLKEAGLLAIAVLSEVDAEPGPLRASPGELRAEFEDLAVVAEGEGEGRAWLVARK
jgi:hypothetical protein